MNPQTLSLRALLFLGLWQTGRRSLASAPELQDQPRKIGKLVPESMSTHKHMSWSVQAPEVALMFLRQTFSGGAVLYCVYVEEITVIAPRYHL